MKELSSQFNISEWEYELECIERALSSRMQGIEDIKTDLSHCDAAISRIEERVKIVRLKLSDLYRLEKEVNNENE